MYGGIDEPPDHPDHPKLFNRASPGDMFPMDADLTIYWPYVRKCWENRENS